MVPDLAKDVSHPQSINPPVRCGGLLGEMKLLEKVLRGGAACGVGAGLTVEVRKFLLEKYLSRSGLGNGGKNINHLI